MPFLTLKIGYFWAKKAPIWHFFGRIMKFFWSNHSAVSPLIWSTHPLLAWGWASKKALFSVFLVVNILKFDINCTFFLGLFSTYQAKNQKARPWGFAPNPTLTCEAAGACGKTYPHSPGLSVGSIQGVKGEMHDCVAVTPFHLLGCSKTIRSGRSRKPVKACEATA